jgi:molecular chaperone GrpE
MEKKDKKKHRNHLEQGNNGQETGIEVRNGTPHDPETESARASGAPPEELKKKLEETEKELKESRDRLLRVAADFENYKKRAAKEREDYLKFANADLIKEILPFMDNLERAINHSEKSNDAQSLVDGARLTLQGLLQRLGKFGVTTVESVGKPFDPAVHEAMLVVETDQHEPNQVVEEFQRGYLLNDRLVRPASVSVSKLPAKDIQATE